MVKTQYYQLTFFEWDDFAQQVADHINESHPGAAIVHENSTGYACFITVKYWEWCKRYVQMRCNIKG